MYVSDTNGFLVIQLGPQLRAARVPEATKLGHLRATAYERFLQSVEVA